MWGNRFGWVVSGVIAVFLGWAVWKMSQLGAITPPSGQFNSILAAPIALPANPAAVLNLTEKRDAGDLYWKVIDQYQADPKPYDTYLNPPKTKEGDKPFLRLEMIGSVPAVQLLIEATPATDANIFLRKPETLVNYQYPYPELDALYRVGMVAGQIGFAHLKKGSPTEAEKYLNAQLSLGLKLFNERVTFSEMNSGVMSMRGALAALAMLADKQGDKAKKEELEALDIQIKIYHESKLAKLYEKVVSIGGQDIKRHAGDVFALATKNPERMWRTEALMKIGRYKYNAGSYQDQVWAKRYLLEPQRLNLPDPAKDPDPAVRAAAVLARDLTIEGYNSIDFTD